MDSIPVSCLNEVMACRVSIKDDIKVGLAATQFVGSDRYAMVVTEVITARKIRVAPMLNEDYREISDTKPIQRLEAEKMVKYVTREGKPSGEIYTLRKNGRWIREGEWLWRTGAVHLGYAETYLDPSF